jgi:hypothetical protein
MRNGCDGTLVSLSDISVLVYRWPLPWGMPIPDQRFLPAIAALVAAGIHELFVLLQISAANRKSIEKRSGLSAT